MMKNLISVEDTPPTFNRDQVAYLKRIFAPKPAPVPQTWDGAIAALSYIAGQGGHLAVIAHIESLVEAQ